MAPMIAFTAESLSTPITTIARPVLIVEDGTIVRLESRHGVELPSGVDLVSFNDCTIAPGFIDIHIHGSAGYDVMQADQSARSHFEHFLARHGVTSYYPTTVTAPLDITLTALERLADAMESAEGRGGGRPLGVHLEGPFLSHARRGVHSPEDLLSPTIVMFDKFWQAARGHIRVMTIAPELDGASDVIAEATRRGVCVSIGHSDATLEFARRGVAVGARHATHTFILGEVLTNENVTADVIADGFHVAPTVIDLLFKAKGPDNIVLITDAISAAGMPDGNYKLGLLEVDVQGGKCVRDGRLAGSALIMDRAVQNVMNFAKCDLQHALRAATANPARVVGAQKKGVLEPGADADFVVLTAEGEVRATVINGTLLQ
ncbi:MAG: N-acetylglucosamine-6-phosphate deacetylase [Acidobacteria bacterium]|nr:MAG: N-acetylglucosamine-6-phosphate deacetylase [Acidobacteriota bacterium]